MRYDNFRARKNVSKESKWTKVSKEDSENLAGVQDDGE